MKLIENQFRTGKRKAGVFEVMPIFPLTLKDAYLTEEILNLYKTIATGLGLSYEAEDEPCIPIGKMGPSLIFAHYSVSGLRDSHWPKEVFQHVQISKSQYLEVLGNFEDVIKKSSNNRVPVEFFAKPIETKEGYLDFVLNDLLPEKALEERLLALKAKKTWKLLDLPEGFKEHFDYMMGRAPIVSLDVVEVSLECFESVSKELQKYYQAICFSKEGKTLFVATSNLENPELKSLLVNRSEGEIDRVVLCVCTPEALEETRQSCTKQRKNGGKHSLKDLGSSERKEVTKGTLEIDTSRVEFLDIQNDTPSPELLFQWILYEAIQRDATDIHMEQFNEGGRVRLRVDGDLGIFFEPNLETMRALVTVCKNVCSMSSNSYDNQDAAFSVKYDEQKINLRVNAIPFRQGFQKLALRILPRKNSLTSLDNLGLAKDHLETLRRAITRKQGLILITGPTGEGKTTTLYAALSEINKPDVNIQTIEDPIEREIDGINQTAVNLSRDVTFASLLRSIVRQDPNVILLGEIRDRESAELAIEAALTGHLVFSTLHANSATKAIQRLVQLKVPHHLIADSLILVQAQRLIKRLCRCKQARGLSLDEGSLFKQEGIKAPEHIFEPMGCAHCDQTGYAGRVAIMELVPVDYGISELILGNENFHKIQKLAKEKGVRTLFGDALLKVSEGSTSLEQAKAFEEVWN